MGHLKDIANQPKIQSFPNSTFEIAGDVPTTQCSEAKIESTTGFTTTAPQRLYDFTDPFDGWNLVGKICHILINPGGNTGDFDITANTANRISFLQNPSDGGPTTYYISNGGTLILTRNIQSFAQFIHAAGYAYTIKGRKLYTNIPSAALQPACSILFNPLT